MVCELNFGIVGATGVVGQTCIDILEHNELNFKINKLKLYASRASIGKSISFKAKKITLEEASLESLLECDVILFATDSNISLEFIPILAEKGILCVDKSSAFRMDQRVPLVVPEVNGYLLNKNNLKSFPVIASPNCCTIPLVMALKPLNDTFGIERVIVSTYQSVSGTGKAGLDILTEEIKSFFNTEDLTSKASSVYPKSIAFNVMPFVASINDNGDSDEEVKIIAETRKILDKAQLAIGATSVRVPVFVGHAESVTVELKSTATLSAIFNAFIQQSGLVLVDKRRTKISTEIEDKSEFAELDFMTPREAHNRDEVFISRVRQTEVLPNGLSFWTVSDNLRKGAALNAIHIVEHCVQKGFFNNSAV